MRKTTRITALLLTLALLFTMLPVTALGAEVEEETFVVEAAADEEVADEAAADEDEPAAVSEENIATASDVVASGTFGEDGDNLTWVLDGDYTLTISGTGDMEDWSSSSGVPWYSYQSSIRSVTIEDGVTSIGDCAFYWCDSLTSITIPSSIASIGSAAFYYCHRLASITIPDSVTSIDEDAFYYCTSLTSVTIPDSVTSIGDNAFGGCTSLTSITIGNGVTSVGDYAFNYCTSLTSITVSPGNSTYSSLDGVLFDKAQSTLICWPGGKDGAYTIPDCVTSIGYYAFGDCDSLTSVTIPDSVTTIGEFAFFYCTSLSSITIGNGVTSIGDEAFYYCTSLTSVTIPDSVTSIGKSAFSDCTSLTSVTIGNSVTSIGSDAFSDCTSLISVTIGNSVTSIGSDAFSDCTSLISVTIGNSVTSIGSDAFCNCTSLTDITVSPENSTYSSLDGVLFDKAQSTLICCPEGKTGAYTIPDSVTSIGNEAFYYCTSLTSITIPDSVTTIGEWAFNGCTGLTSVTIPDSVTFIDERAFCGCTSLTSVTASPGNSTYSSLDGVLFDKEQSTLICYPGGKAGTYIITDSVTSIGNHAFQSCDSLTSVTIPDSVTNIGYCSFFWCSCLTDVYYAGSEDDWAAIDIDYGNDCLTDATIHYGDSEASAYGTDTEENLVLTYTALAKIGYSDFSSGDLGKTVAELVAAGKHSEFSNAANDMIWDNQDVTYTQFYTDVIGAYVLVGVYDENDTNGFYGMCLKAPDGTYVISYRGTDTNYEWVTPDFQMAIFSTLNQQFDCAMDFYNMMLELGVDADKIVLTGHSLGGALATYVSILTGTLAYTIDGADAYAIDSTFVKQWAQLDNFEGVDSFNFINFTDETGDTVADLIQSNYSGSYPMRQYETTNTTHLTEQWLIAMVIAGSHHAMSYLQYNDSTGKFTLNALKQTYTCTSVASFSSLLLETQANVYLGTSGRDDIDVALDIRGMLKVLTPNYLFGGDGIDSLYGYTVNDYLCGGSGNSILNGFTGSDTYIIDVGNDYKYNTDITDPSGSDKIILRGYDSDVHGSVEISEYDSDYCISFSELNQLIYITKSRFPLSGAIQLLTMDSSGNTTVLSSNIINDAKENTVTSSTKHGANNGDISAASDEQAEDTEAIKTFAISGDVTLCVYKEDGTIITTYSTGDDLYAGERGMIYTAGENVLGCLYYSTDYVTVSGEDTQDVVVHHYSDEEVVDYCVYAESIDLTEAELTIDSIDDNGKQTISVGGTEIEVQEYIVLQSITLSPSTLEMKVGENAQLTPVLSPANATCQDISWKSSDATIVAVDENGVVSAIKAGEATIYAISDGSDQVSGTCTITVSASEHVYNTTPEWAWASDYSSATATFTCTEGDDTQTVSATITSETTAATYTAAGKTVYTATVTFNGETYTDTQTVTIAKLTLATPAVTLSNTSSGVKISWGAVTGADRYRVYRKASGDSSWTTLGYTTSTSYTDADAVSDTTYYYTVRAYCGSAYSSYSSKTIIRLAQPTVSLSNTSSGVKISWGKVTGATSYKVYRKTSSGSSFSRIATISSGSTVTYTDTTAKSGTTYYYTVQAYNGSYKSSYVSNKTIVRLAQPTVSLSNTSSGVKVSWGAVTGATKYRVYRKASGATSWTTVKSSTTSTSYTDTAVKSKNGTTYYYAVRAYSGSYSSSYVTNKAIVRLTTPTLSSVTNSASKKMTVKWTKVSGVTGYQIQYSTSSSFSSYTTVKVTGASSVSKVISSLTKGKTYYVRIRTYKTVSGTNYYSGWSSKKSVKISK